VTPLDILEPLIQVIDALEALSVSYSIAGSVASSAHGTARATLDADLVADLKLQHVEPLVAALARDFYLDRDAIVDAVERRAMFNVVHLSTMLKVDVYLLSGRPFDQQSFARRARSSLGGRAARAVSLDTPEDTILHKLEWYRAGGEVSERQWGDVLGVIRVQGQALDGEYMRRWAAEVGVSDLLERALGEAGPDS
jgi:hypothetical protein